MIKDLAVDHSYYCSDTNYYSNDTNYHFDTWKDFMDEMGDADIDWNFLFRWDIKLNEDDEYYMELFYMLQRKGKFIICTVGKVTDEDEESIKEFLSKYWQYMTELWKPISK